MKHNLKTDYNVRTYCINLNQLGECDRKQKCVGYDSWAVDLDKVERCPSQETIDDALNNNTEKPKGRGRLKVMSDIRGYCTNLREVIPNQGYVCAKTDGVCVGSKKGGFLRNKYSLNSMPIMLCPDRETLVYKIFDLGLLDKQD
jgi:hypothetical protein